MRMILHRLLPLVAIGEHLTVALAQLHSLDHLALVTLHLARRERAAQPRLLDVEPRSVPTPATRRSNSARISGNRASPIVCFNASRINERSSITASRSMPRSAHTSCHLAAARLRLLPASSSTPVAARLPQLQPAAADSPCSAAIA